ncbi:MAG TPA: hypothetical protein VJS43_14255 [Candidatus Acidoferrales bacterium]|nr:hypothetical protein [Candidatus Acidoferrales bacterium]
MLPSLKSAVRILSLTILLFGACSLPGVDIARGAVAAPPRAQAAQPKPQRPAQAGPQRSGVGTPGNNVDQGGQDQNENQQMDEQLIQMRKQLEQEAMSRMRNGSPPAPLDRALNDLIPFFVFVGITLALLWILRVTLDHRRWSKMVRVQTETHAKLLDKFGSSQDMLAYMDSEAGKKFLETPAFDTQIGQAAALPYSRILWSVQIGVIAAALGAGLLYLRGRVGADSELGFDVFGTLVCTLGIGFLVSGGVSYALAKHFGLLRRNDGASQSAVHSSSS